MHHSRGGNINSLSSCEEGHLCTVRGGIWQPSLQTPSLVSVLSICRGWMSSSLTCSCGSSSEAMHLGPRFILSAGSLVCPCSIRVLLSLYGLSTRAGRLLTWQLRTRQSIRTGLGASAWVITAQDRLAQASFRVTPRINMGGYTKVERKAHWATKSIVC